MFFNSRRSMLCTGLLLALPLALVATGCGEEEEVDPYVYGSLDAVSRGWVESDQFLFEIDAPEIVFVHGNTGIVRSRDHENHLEVLVMDDFENRASALSGKLVGVQKFYSPYVWLMAKRLKDGMNVTELDSVPNPVLPAFTDVKLEEVTGYDLSKLDARARQSDLDDMLEAEVQTVGSLVYRADHEAVADEGAAADTTATEPAMAWYLVAPENEATFKVANVTPQLEFAFRLLENEGLPFVGGIQFTEAYPRSERRASGVSGEAKVQWVRYANRYLAP